MQMTHDHENPTAEPNITSIGITSIKTRNAIEIGVRQSGQPLSIAETLSAQLTHNLEWPHDTRATPERGVMRHTSQSSATLVTDGCVEVETSSPAADVDVAELEACAVSAGAVSMSSSSSSLASGANWNASVCVRRGCGTWRARTTSVRHPSQTAVYCT